MSEIKSFDDRQKHVLQQKLKEYSSEENLQFQNNALATRLDYLKIKLNDVNKEKSTLQQSLNTQNQFLGNFYHLWKNFLNELEQTYNFQKKPQDDKHGSKLLYCFTFLDDFLNFRENFKDDKNDSTKTINNKSQIFLNNIKNVFQELYIDMQKNTEKLNMMKQQLLNQETNLSAKMIYEENRLLHKKLKDLEGQIQKNSQLIQDQNNAFSQIIKENNSTSQSHEIQQKNKELMQINENLTRRLRFHRNYNFKSINQLIQNIDPHLDTNFQCVCGGEFVEIVQNHEKIEIKEEKQVEKIQEEGNIQIFSGQLEQYIEEKCRIQKELDELQISLNNSDERFFKSKIFAGLVSQTIDILKQLNYYKDLLKKANKNILEIENLRLLEVQEINQFWQSKIEKLNEQINKLNVEKNNKQQDLSKMLDISPHSKGITEQLQIALKNTQNINQENKNLTNIVKELKQKLEQEIECHQQDKDKLQNLQMHQYFTQEKQNIFDISYKNGKYRESVQEIDKLIKQYLPNLRPKFEELMIFVKSREQKVEYLDQKLKQALNDQKNQKKFTDQLMQEIELNGKNTTDIIQQKEKLVSQIKDLDETFNKMAIEKYTNKNAYENEKQALNQKIKADQEIQSLQLQQIDQYKSLIKNNDEIIQEKNGVENLLQNQINELKQSKEEIQKQLEDQKISQKLKLDLEQDYFKVNKKYIQELEETKLNIQQKDKVIQELKETPQSSRKQMTSNEHQILSIQLEKYKNMIKCNNCETRDKCMILKPCNHMFCKECIDKNVQLRQRYCFLCKTKFSNEDVQKIFFG